MRNIGVFLSKHVFFEIFVPLFLFSWSLEAQCDKKLKIDPNSQNAYVKRENRCEGIYISNVSSAGIELVSATIGKLSYDLSEKEIIEVTSPLYEQSIRIRAAGIPLKTYYRMDADLLADSSLLWPVDKILLPRNLDAAKVGLLGWYKNQNDLVYVPLLAKPKLNKIVNDGNIWLILRSSIDVAKVQWRFGAVKNGRTEKLSKWISCSPASFKSGNPIPVKLPAMTEQVIYVEVAAKDNLTDQWLKKNFRIIVSNH